ncbi:hypothetical protein Tco_0791711 [Tanacetum coccineum]
MSNMSEDIQYAGSDTRPPMLDRTYFDSWQQRIRLYCLVKRNGENIMKSITEGPFQMGMFIQTVAEETEGALQLGPERARVFTDLTAKEKERYKADIRATNILLQGIPKDIYTLINHYTDAKDIWDNVKIILEGSEFITEVKLNRGLKESNFDQLYAYLKQYEVHANENRMMMERFIQPTNDPLALVSNASIQQYPTQSSMSQSTNQPSPADNFQMDSGSSSTENLIESLTNSLSLLTQSYKSNLPQTNNQLRTSSNARNKATVQDGRVVVQDVRDSNYFKDKMLLMQAQENDAVLDEEQLSFLAGEQVTNFDDDVDDPPEQDLKLNVDHVFEADQLDAFDSDVDEAPTTHTMFMANLTSEDPIFNEAETSNDSDIPFEVQDHDNYHDSVYEPHDVHKMQNNIQQDYVVDSEADYMSNSNIISYDQYVEDNTEHVVQSNVSSVQNDALRSIINEIHEEGVQSRIVIKQDRVVKDSLNSELARYKSWSGKNYLAIFAPQRDLTPEQIFWDKDENDRKKVEATVLKPLSTPTVYPPNTSVKLVPRVLLTKSQVKINLYTLIQLFTEFDKTCKKRITPTGVIEGERGLEQTKRCYLTEVIPFFKTLKQHIEGVQKALFKEVKEMEEIFDQMSAEVDQNIVDKQCAEIERKNLLIANENLIANCLSNQLMFAVEQSRCLDLEAEISELQNKNQKDVNDEMIRGFNKLEVEYLNLQLKYHPSR